MKKKAGRILILAILSIVLIAAVLVGRYFWKKSNSIETFFDKAFQTLLEDDPEQLSIYQPYFLAGSMRVNIRLTSVAPETATLQVSKAKALLAELTAFDLAQQSHENQLTAKALSWELEQRIAESDFLFHNYPIAHSGGNIEDFSLHLVLNQPIRTKREVEAFMNRLWQFYPKVSDIIAATEFRIEKGIIPPQIIVEQTQKLLKHLKETPIIEHPIYRSFARKIVRFPATTINEYEAGTYMQRLAELLREQVYPAYEKLDEYLAELAPKARQTISAQGLPNGDAYYKYLLERYTSVPLSPDSLHRWGIIQLEVWKNKRDSLEKNFTVSNKDEVPSNLDISEIKKIVEDITYKTQGLFDSLPTGRLIVRRLPNWPTNPPGTMYYQPPTLDGKRLGSLYVNLPDTATADSRKIRIQSYLNGVPGSHLQTIWQQKSQKTAFRKWLNFPGFREGWATYGLYLMDNDLMLFSGNPELKWDYISHRMAQYVLLIVDTGIHHQGWNRTKAIEFLSSEKLFSPAEVIYFVDRIILFPGKVCSNPVGFHKILDLRNTAKNQSGEGFYIQKFHESLLNNGPLPFPILQNL